MARQKTETKPVDGMPHPEVLKTLASQVSRSQADMDTARGEIGSTMKNAEDKHQVHRKAFKQSIVLRKMDSTKLAEYLRHFDHYRQVFELDKLAGTDMLRENNAEQMAKAAGVADTPAETVAESVEDDPRPDSLKRRHAEIEAEQQAADAPAETADAVAAKDNVTKLRRGIRGMPGSVATATVQ